MKEQNFFMGTQSVATRLPRLVIALISSFLLLQFVSVYLSWPKQILLGGVSIVTALVINRLSKSHIVTISLMLISLAATLRYGWWRFHTIFQFFSDESNNRFTIDSFLMLVLLSAEAYTILIMILGFMQTSFPLHRKPIPLPDDESLWPHVDVLIPTYNEPLSLVRYTAFAANNIDYPPEKLHVYILDDGTRQSFREFAEEAGIGYITREKHDHAKAGNINHALRQMSSELVTIFDCDHVPTRSFLQVTVGWFLAQNKLAMLQTPHHFYSPDPFERNLLQYKTIPNEGELFYGIIQDGNDLWNATFFCGSCAVIRRAALDEVGGIAVETVTEDAHTSLRMQKRGWNTAYINLPQAAGLATETLAAHVGQRVRWARGMIQILRTDNPLLASGMKLTQRLCYFNAMLHFMYAVPRLIFLCAPLIYMLAGRTIIPGYWLAILAYALPHLFLSSLTNSRVQGRHRHSFWNEIYETVLAPYILLPTFLALINPKLGKFNVTDKGSTLNETRYDRNIATPTTLLLALNFLGLCIAPYRLMVTDRAHPGTVLSNLAWILFNMVILGVAAAVANEQQQRRHSVRIAARIPIRMHRSGGEAVSGVTEDMSVGGASLRLSGNSSLAIGEVLRLSFPMQTGDAEIPAKIVGLHNNTLRVEFDELSLVEQETLTCALYSRANSWIASREVEEDRPMRSLGRVIRLSFTGFHQVLRSLLPAKKEAHSARNEVVAAASILLFVAMLSPLAVRAQTEGSQFPGVVPASVAREPDPQATATSAALATTNAPKRPAITLYTPDATQVSDSDANYRITFKDMGVKDLVPMHGPHSVYSLGFVLEHTRIPRRATLNLAYHFSATLLPRAGSIKVSLNNIPIALIAAPEQPQHEGEYASVSLPLPAESLVRNNQLTFEFTGGTLLQLESNAKSVALASIGASSRVLIAGDSVPFNRDVSLLPLPLFDPDLQTTSSIAFVFPTNPSPATLQAASIVASWLGILTSTKPIHYTVAIGEIPRGNIIFFNNGSTSLPDSLKASGNGPFLSIKANPSDPDGNALILSGNDDDQLLTVARSLSLMTVSRSQQSGRLPLLGESTAIGDFPLPAPREPDDAPRWLRTDQLTSLWALSSEQGLQSDGSRPLPVYFRVPPDLNYGETQNLNLKLTYRYNPKAVANGSAVRVFINGALLPEIPMQPDAGANNKERTIVLPTADMRPFGNTLLFNFDFIPKDSRADRQRPSDALSGSILKQSFLDIRGMAHRAQMPNLELFANAGFPFTRRADLAETVVIMPSAPTTGEIAMLLYLMSHCGTQTGYPVLRVEISGPEAVMRGDRDYLVLGSVSDQPALGALDAHFPVVLASDGVHVKDRSGYLAAFRSFRNRLLGTFWPRYRTSPDPSNDDVAPDLLIEGIESPFFAGRSIVAVTMQNDAAVEQFAPAFFERSQSSDIAHSVSLLRNGRFTSYDMPTGEYHVGYIAPYPLMRLWLAENFWVLFTAVTLLSLLLAIYARDYLELLARARLEER
jgi:cellulose synthase (UDP-forming)